jgi:hypothetical protein
MVTSLTYDGFLGIKERQAQVCGSDAPLGGIMRRRELPHAFAHGSMALVVPCPGAIRGPDATTAGISSTMQACRDTKVYLGANKSAKANPADAALQGHVQAVKKEPGLAEAVLDTSILHQYFIS